MFRRAQNTYPTSRLLTALLGLVLLLGGHVPVNAFTAAAESLSCCQDGHSCCRRAHHHATQHEGPDFRAQTCSGSGCCVHPGTTAIAVHADAKPANIDHTAALEWRAPARAGRATSRRHLTTNLFQRPPPFFA